MTAAAAQPDPIQPAASRAGSREEVVPRASNLARDGAAPAGASQLAPAPVTPTQAADGPHISVRRGGRNEGEDGCPILSPPLRKGGIEQNGELAPFLIHQTPAAYTAEDHAVWRLLFARRMEHLRQVGSRAFLRGIEAIGLTPDRVPSLDEMNARLEPITGWRAIAVSGFLEPRLFFQCLAERRFPTTVIVRPLEQLEYLPEPDIFHDVFGHVPMHADPVFADFLERFGAIASTARNQAEVRMLTRLFWFTVEFGLIRENGSAKVYGSGLISSMADCKNALGPYCERRPFVLDDVLAQEFEIDHLQPVLFVIDSHQQLFAAVEEVRGRMSKGLLAEDADASEEEVRLCAHDHGKPAQECQQDLP